MRTRYYRVADHCFALEFGDAWQCQSYENFTPFEVEPNAIDTNRLLFHLSQADSFQDETSTPTECAQNISAESDELSITYQPMDGKFQHYLTLGFRNMKPCCSVRCSSDFSQVEFCLYGNDTYHPFALSNLIMLVYALSSADQGTLMFHASVIVNARKGYLFLGKSGTGKSTHAALWLKHIAGSERLNDDNPIVRIHAPHTITVYGSPWSGKTPCYRAEQASVGAIVKLSQAPHNHIRRLSLLEAYASVMPSVSSLRWYRPVADGIHASLDRLVQDVPVYALQCLPDAAAAQLCQQTLTSK